LTCGPATCAWLHAGNRTLTALNLSQNAIGDRGATALAEALKLNSTLARLDLSGNAIDEAGARALASALRENHGLVSLSIGDNYLGEAGAKVRFGSLGCAQSPPLR
jgi:Ran GTPase-activating protein (RanGAP) involved in mRNA processing and transport